MSGGVSSLSDDDLMRMLGRPAAPAPQPGGASAMSDDDLLKALGRPPKPTVMSDVAQAVPAGVARGAAGLIGLPGFAQEGASWLARQTAGRARNYIERGSLEAPSAEETAARDQAVRDAGPFNVSLPTPQGVTRAIESVTGKLYEPQTTAGKFANVAGEFAAGGLTPGSLGRRAANVLVPAGVSEGAGQIADQAAPEYATAARVVGGLAGGVAAAAGQVPRGANALTSEALQSAQITQPELRAAYALQDAGQTRGVTLTLDEALNQVTDGRAQRLSQLRRVAEYSGGEGAAPLAEITAGRAGQVRQAAQAETAQIAPNPYPADQAAQQGRNAGEAALQRLRNERTEAVDPNYQRARTDTVPEGDMRSVIAGIDQDIAANANNPELVTGLRDLRARLIETPAVPEQAGIPATRTPVMGPNGQVIRYETRPGTPSTPAVPERPYTNVGELDAVAKSTRDAYGTAGGVQIGETATQKRAAQLTRQGVGNLNQTLTNASPELAAGRDLYGQITRGVVTPAEQGPIGAIAQRLDPSAEGASASMGRALAGAGQGDRYDAVVQQAARRIVREDPRAAQTIARDYIADKFTTAMGDLQAGGNPNAGAAARKSLFGNEADQNNIRAMLTQLPGGQARATAFDQLMGIFEATGYRPPKGSDTAFNQAIQQDARQSAGLAGQAIGTISQGGLNIKRALADRVARYRLGNNMAEIASVLTSPAARPLLEQLARAPAGSNRALGLALRLTFLGEQSANGAGAARPVP